MQWDLLVLALLAQWLDNATGNLIPPGAMYDGFGNYSLIVAVPHTYTWIKGANDVQITDFNGHVCNTTCTSLFVAPLLLRGQFNQPVTAQLIFVS